MSDESEERERELLRISAEIEAAFQHRRAYSRTIEDAEQMIQNLDRKIRKLHAKGRRIQYGEPEPDLRDETPFEDFPEDWQTFPPEH